MEQQVTEIDSSEEILRQRIEYLHNRSLPGLSASIIAGCIMTWMLWNETDNNSLLFWLSLMVVINLLRIAFTYYYKKRAPLQISNNKILFLYYVGTVLSGIIWGMSSYMLMPGGSIITAGFIILFISGLTSGTTSNYSVFKFMYFGFAVPALGIPMIYLFNQGITEYQNLGIMVLFFTIFISMIAMRNHKQISESIILDNNNKNLLQHLNNQQEENDLLAKGYQDMRNLNEQLNAQLEEANNRIAQLESKK